LKRPPAATFETVSTVALALPDVEVATKYDGSPVLRVGGVFLAGVATHRSAEAESLVVRIGFEERDWLLEDAPETYYVTDYYRPYPLVLVRLSRIGRDALRDLLSVSWRVTVAKTRKRGSAGGERQLPGGAAAARGAHRTGPRSGARPRVSAARRRRRRAG
jgi:hypothetical protein